MNNLNQIAKGLIGFSVILGLLIAIEITLIAKGYSIIAHLGVGASAGICVYSLANLCRRWNRIGE